MTSIILTRSSSSSMGLMNGLRAASRRLKWSSRSIVRKNSSSATAAATTDVVDSAGVPYSLYMWGTNQKGIIPVSTESSSNSSNTASTILNSSKDVYDHPIAIDLQKAYTIGTYVHTFHNNIIMIRKRNGI